MIEMMLGVANEPTFEFGKFQGCANAIIAYSASFRGDDAVSATVLRAREKFSAFTFLIIPAGRARPSKHDDLCSKLLNSSRILIW